jgi:hypothetical protein
MTVRSHSEAVVFRSAFLLKGVDRVLPPGSYRVVTEEELIESLSFPVYRRMSTVIFVPGPAQRGTWEMIGIEPADLIAAQDRDQSRDAAAALADATEPASSHDHR